MIDDLTLLRRFEPVLSFTQGEMFFPMSVTDYLPYCTRWARGPDGVARRTADVGEVTPDTLGRRGRWEPGGPEPGPEYLRFVQRPMDLPAYLRWRRDPARPSFEAVGRWARVGLTARLLDAVFDATSALRGHVPGGTTAVAEQQYRRSVGPQPEYTYYGRVVRDGGYTVLQYLFFYAMNDFRSSFYGVNDHEADWEQVLVYVVEDEEHPDDLARVSPVWLGCAGHDLSGPDLRRRWDDPELSRVDDTHPVISVAAGSHAAYFAPGEYLLGVLPAFLAPGQRLVAAARRVWRETLGQGARRGTRPSGPERLSVPFVDYARGDGLRVGPGARPWNAVLLRGGEPWVENYRGLWGLDTRDPLGGNRAPGGPKHGRDGQPRRSWYDPLGFGGLESSVPPPRTASALRRRLVVLGQEQARVRSEVDELRGRLRDEELDRQALGPVAGPVTTDDDQEQSTAREPLRQRLCRLNEIGDTERAVRAAVLAVESGEATDPRAHLRRPHEPLPRMDRMSTGGELWSATSGGLLLLLLAVLPAVGTPNRLLSLVIAVAAIFGVDAVVRGRGVRYALGYTVVLAVVGAGYLLVVYWKVALVGGIAFFVLSAVRDNVRELRSLRHRAVSSHRSRGAAAVAPEPEVHDSSH
jgi:hypothetical protein